MAEEFLPGEARYGADLLASGPVMLYAHLPGVQLKGAVSFDIGPGQLVALEVDKWQLLDPERGERPGEAYRQTKPVFYAEERLPDVDVRTTMERLQVRADNIQAAIMLLSGVGLPHPAMSMSYIFNPRTEAGARRMGPMEREAILRHPVHLKLDKHLALKVDEVAGIVACPRCEGGVIGYALDSLRLAATPGMGSADGLVLIVMALENLLLGGRQTKISTTFSRRGAVVTANSSSDAQRRFGTLRIIYKLRSQILHGQAFYHELHKRKIDATEIWREACEILADTTLATLRYLTNAPTQSIESWLAELDTKAAVLLE